MAADMTDETIAQYMERIEKMSIKEIQKEIEFLESPGYNCEGLVCADGVITPRTKMHRKVLWYKRMNQKSLTALQWAKEGYVVNPDATGFNDLEAASAIGWLAREDKEAAKEFLKSRRKEKKE